LGLLLEIKETEPQTRRGLCRKPVTKKFDSFMDSRPCNKSVIKRKVCNRRDQRTHTIHFPSEYSKPK
jgi:hypothetical protein